MSVVTSELAEVERELARLRPFHGFRDDALEGRYRQERRAADRVGRWVTLALLVAIYDAYLLAELSAAPEIVVLSAWLRFAVLTPAALAYIVCDWRFGPARWGDSVFAALLVAPTLISAVEARHYASPAILQAFEATPLLQLSVLSFRAGFGYAAAAAGGQCLVFAVAALSTPVVPHSVLPSLLLLDGAITVAVLVFNLRMDRRDRQVFLFTWQAEVRGRMLADQNRSLMRLSQVDPLTGLGNRRRFDERLAAMWADERARGQDVALVMLDIDYFKPFNDTLGHQAGDDCLAALGDVLAGCVRDERDTLVRYGGEEFATILPSASLAEGWSIAERIREAVLDRAIPHAGGGASGVVTVSLGVASVRPAEHSVATLIERADRCLYAAKRAGRNRTVMDADARGAGAFGVAPARDDAASASMTATLP